MKPKKDSNLFHYFSTENRDKADKKRAEQIVPLNPNSDKNTIQLPAI